MNDICIINNSLFIFCIYIIYGEGEEFLLLHIFFFPNAYCTANDHYMEQCQLMVLQIANVAEEWFISCLGQYCKTNFLFIPREMLAVLTQH